MKKQHSEARAVSRTRTSRSRLVLTAGLVLATLFLLWAGSARAQFPRIGISAAPDHYVDYLDVNADEEFTLYVGVFPADDQTLLNQEFSTVSWVLHQVCCGAVLYVQDVDYTNLFQHQGDPNLGVISSAETCVDEPFITLATLSMLMVAPADGEYLAACGPYQQAVDCQGENPILMGSPMTLNISGVGATPVDKPTWDSLKAAYR